MSNDVYIAKVIERLTNASQLNDSEFLRAWGSCINGDVARRVSDVESLVNAESVERVAAIDADYRSPQAIICAAGITNVFEAQIKRNALDAEDTVRVLNCCLGKNIALAADLVRRLLDNLPQLIPLASQQLLQLCYQSAELPADKQPNEISLRGMAYLTLAEGGTQYAPSLLHADRAQQECIETLWNWRLGSLTPWKLYRYEDAVNAMLDAVRKCKAMISNQRADSEGSGN